jgi:2,4-dienoyl-CoA reductase-like NADH-dependent reductase (Old Yellow Enzyme family)
VIFELSKLLSALDIGKLYLNNRLVMPPMATAKASADGCVTDAVLQYYDEKSKGGYLSLIIVEHCYVNPQGRASGNQLSAADDNTIEGWKRLADVIRKNGSKAAMQLNHAGSAADGVFEAIAAPSAVAHPMKKTVPAELTKEQIGKVVEAFGKAAYRARTAGFDAVEIHSAHGYLLNQFYSPLTNKRKDEYGGSLYNRIRIHLEIIKAVRASAGDDFPILLRLGGCDYMEGGSTVEDSVEAAVAFEKAGVDILDVSGGFLGFNNPLSAEPGYFSDMTAAIKQKVKIPVILTGGITTAVQAEDLLAKGVADLIGVGRAVLKDSNWTANAVREMER